MSAYRNAMMEEGNLSDLRWAVTKAWAESDALRAENERLKDLLHQGRAYVWSYVRSNSHTIAEEARARMVLADIDAALESGEIRAALPTETGTTLEKHGISEE